jgi:methionine-gamma-lyase
MDKRKDPGAMRKSTKAIHIGGLEEPIFGEVSVPLFQSSTFSFPNVEEGAARFSGRKPGYIYTRLDNPTVKALEENVAALEGGVAGIAAASGMAAITTIYIAFLDQDAHIVATDAIYGPSRTVLETQLSRFGVASTFVNTSKPERIAQAIQPNTRMVFIETPTNPTLDIVDIRSAAEIAHQHGAILVVDNTFASPYLQRPIEHGTATVMSLAA